MKKVLLILLSICLLSLGIYFFIKFNDDEVVKIRFERHGAYGYELMIMVSDSGQLDVYVSENVVGSSDVDKWIQVQSTHKKTTISPNQLEEIKDLTSEIFWKEWFFYDGHIVWDDIDGYWYRILYINGKKYDFYNYPYRDNKLNRIIELVVKLSPIEIVLDKQANIISIGGDVQ